MFEALWARLARVHTLPRAFFLVLGLKVLESYADFVVSLNLSLYLTDIGYTDTEAGFWFGAWGLSTSACGIALGSTIDRLGVRRSLLIGATFSLAGRLLLVVSRDYALFSLVILQSIGEAFAIPVLSIAIRQLVTAEALALAFSLFYMAMQVGAIGSGVLTDAIRDVAGPRYSMAALFWSAVVVTAIYLVVVYRSFPHEALAKGPAPPPVTSFAEAARTTFADATFWRLVGFSLALTGSRTVWSHVGVSLPKFIQRTLGVSARYGDVNAINPFLVLLTVTFAQAATAAYDAYDVIVVGTLITALSPLTLYVLPTSYAALIVFECVLSLGEILYSPRVYEFSLRIAPRGREGVYSALASAPTFLIRAASGASSGLLLARYCPPSGYDATSYLTHCQTLWLVVCLGALTTPLALMLAHRCLYDAEVRRRTHDSDTVI